MLNKQEIDMTFLRTQLRTDEYAIKFEVNKFTGVGMCHLSKEFYDTLPDDFAERIKEEVTRLLDDAIMKAVASAIAKCLSGESNAKNSDS